MSDFPPPGDPDRAHGASPPDLDATTDLSGVAAGPTRVTPLEPPQPRAGFAPAAGPPKFLRSRIVPAIVGISVAATSLAGFAWSNARDREQARARAAAAAEPAAVEPDPTPIPAPTPTPTSERAPTPAALAPATPAPAATVAALPAPPIDPAPAPDPAPAAPTPTTPTFRLHDVPADKLPSAPGVEVLSAQGIVGRAVDVTVDHLAKPSLSGSEIAAGGLSITVKVRDDLTPQRLQFSSDTPYFQVLIAPGAYQEVDRRDGFVTYRVDAQVQTFNRAPFEGWFDADLEVVGEDGAVTRLTIAEVLQVTSTPNQDPDKAFLASEGKKIDADMGSSDSRARPKSNPEGYLVPADTVAVVTREAIRNMDNGGQFGPGGMVL